MTDAIPLFQFRKIDNYLFQTIVNKILWFSSPRVFNDPFDCQLPVQVDNTLDEIQKYLFLKNKDQKYTNESLIKRANEFYQNKQELVEFLRDKFFMRMRFSCFSKDEGLIYKNSTMWGNYADKSRGVCLKFLFENELKNSFNLDSDVEVAPIKVIYEGKIPVFNYIRYKLGIKQGMSSSAQYYLGIKSNDWKDESEVRLVIRKSQEPFKDEYIGIRYNANCLKEIILGCNSTDEDKALFESLINCNPEYSHVNVIKLAKSKRNFEFCAQ